MASKPLRKRLLSVEEILRWASSSREAVGRWPTKSSGGIVGARFETWAGVDEALRRGWRGRTRGSSLAQLLAESRGVRNLHDLPPLTEEQLLRWADDHHARTGSWPTQQSGPVPESPGDSWWAIDAALRDGNRGLKPGSSLGRLLARHRGRRNHMDAPRLTKR